MNSTITENAPSNCESSNKCTEGVYSYLNIGIGISNHYYLNVRVIFVIFTTIIPILGRFHLCFSFLEKCKEKVKSRLITENDARNSYAT